MGKFIIDHDGDIINLNPNMIKQVGRIEVTETEISFKISYIDDTHSYLVFMLSDYSEDVSTIQKKIEKYRLDIATILNDNNTPENIFSVIDLKK